MRIKDIPTTNSIISTDMAMTDVAVTDIAMVTVADITRAAGATLAVRLDKLEAKLDEVLALLRPAEKATDEPFRCDRVGCTLGRPHDHYETNLWRTAINATWQPHPEDAPGDGAPVWLTPINDPNGGRR